MYKHSLPWDNEMLGLFGSSYRFTVAQCEHGPMHSDRTGSTHLFIHFRFRGFTIYVVSAYVFRKSMLPTSEKCLAGTRPTLSSSPNLFALGKQRLVIAPLGVGMAIPGDIDE